MTKRLRLRDGRGLAYDACGVPDGVPIFLFHGTPNSGLIRPDPSVVEAAGVYLILPDRPGFGESDFQPHRMLLDWPQDVAELAEALEIGRFGVVGVSGGGPHAAACGYVLSDRISSVALVSSAPPLWDFCGSENWRIEEAAPRTRDLITLARASATSAEQRAFEVCEAELALIRRDPELWLDAWAASAPPADQELIADPDVRAMYIASGRQAALQGASGYAHELLLLYTKSWGFSPAKIEVPVSIWHGERDESVPANFARLLADVIPVARIHIGAIDGHLMFHSYGQKILETLVSEHNLDAAARRRAELPGLAG